jgi:hypothetical protein
MAFDVTGQLSLSAGTGGKVWEVDLTPVSGGNIGTTNQSQTAMQLTVPGGGGVITVTHTRTFVPTAGLAYKHVFRCISPAPGTLYSPFYQSSAVLAGIHG